MHLSSRVITTSLIVALPLLITACTPSSAPVDSSSSSVSSVSSVSSPHPDITPAQPTPNATVSSPLTVTGEARGTWYFEASFPVRLLDANNNEIAVAPAQAQGEWMTTDFVPYQATLTFTATTPTGTLILEKDNPSGEPQNADSISIPVQFAP